MSRTRLLGAVQVAFGLVVVGFVVVALVRNWSAVGAELGRVGLGSVLLASLGTALAVLFTLQAWRVLLADLGTRLALPPAASVFLVGQLGKYLPGSLWTVLAQAQMGARLGVPRRRMAVVGLLGIGFGVVAGGILGLPALPSLLRRSGAGYAPYVGLATVVVAGLAFWPRVVNGAVAWGLSRLGREPLEHALSGRAVVVTMGWSFLAWLAMGSASLVLARDVAPAVPLGRLAFVSVLGFALAGVAGMFSVFVPAGVGVRDGLLVVLLASLMPLASATAVVVVGRFLSVAVDVALAALGWLWGRAHHLLGVGRAGPGG